MESNERDIPECEGGLRTNVPHSGKDDGRGAANNNDEKTVRGECQHLNTEWPLEVETNTKKVPEMDGPTETLPLDVDEEIKPEILRSVASEQSRSLSEVGPDAQTLITEIHEGVEYLPEGAFSEQISPEVAEDETTLKSVTVGKFSFDVGEYRADYDSDESFYCCSDDDHDDNDDDELVDDESSSGDEGDYDLNLEEKGDVMKDEHDGRDDDVDGALQAVSDVNEVLDEVDGESQFPWMDAGVVDLETASNWDFTILTKSCKPVAREIIERALSLTRRLRRVEDFRVRIRQEPQIDGDQNNRIFLNLDQVLKLQCVILAEFKKELIKRPLKPRVGQILRRYSPYLKLHEQLVCHNNSCRNAIKQLMRGNPAFRTAHDHFKASGDRLDIAELLMEPYKYIIDCKCQLTRYIKVTRDQEDRKDAEVALSIVESVLNAIDGQSMVYYETNSRMLQIRPLFKKMKIEIMKAHRSLKLEGKMSLISPQDGLPHCCEVFLFNDIMLLCTPHLVEAWMSSVRVIGMRRTVVTRENNNTIVVYSPDKVVELQFSGSDGETWDKWFKALTDVANPQPDFEIEDKHVRVDAELGSRAPRYQLARNVKECSLCRKAFMRRSRNVCHCHACGHVVCVACCSRKVPLSYGTHTVRRVCDECWRHLQIQATNYNRPL